MNKLDLRISADDIEELYSNNRLRLISEYLILAVFGNKQLLLTTQNGSPNFIIMEDDKIIFSKNVSINMIESEFDEIIHTYMKEQNEIEYVGDDTPPEDEPDEDNDDNSDMEYEKQKERVEEVREAAKVFISVLTEGYDYNIDIDEFIDNMSGLMIEEYGIPIRIPTPYRNENGEVKVADFSDYDDVEDTEGIISSIDRNEYFK